ncbi:hypothetical protein GGU11DRAFT_839354 [Lentinula aff. detonsa]|nr:hypothetical protein GGU11DRAFT_839354 [Lentinula aff. detonsa]
MSLAPPVIIASPLSSYTPPAVPRKRTTSFCCSSTSCSFTPNPRPTKVPRTAMGSLRRTESFLCLRDMQKKSTSTANATADRKQRERTKAKSMDYTAYVAAAKSSSSASSPSSLPPSPVFQRAASIPPIPPKPTQYSCTYRSSSPLSPHRTALPGRPIFPKSKAEPDLYKKAITTRMRCTPEGQRILHMGPKLAVSIMTATKELERIVAAQAPDDNDMAMSESSPILSNSWVVVSSTNQDWEMLDCGA